MRQASVSPFAIQRVVSLVVRCLLCTVQNMQGGREQGLLFVNCFFRRLEQTQTPAQGGYVTLWRADPWRLEYASNKCIQAFSSEACLQNVDLCAMTLSTSNFTLRLARAIPGILQHMLPIGIPKVHPSIKKAPPWQELHPSSLPDSHHCLLVANPPLLQRHRKPHNHLLHCYQELIQYT